MSHSAMLDALRLDTLGLRLLSTLDLLVQLLAMPNCEKQLPFGKP